MYCKIVSSVVNKKTTGQLLASINVYHRQQTNLMQLIMSVCISEINMIKTGALLESYCTAF
jgi:hypothetical protein